MKYKYTVLSNQYWESKNTHLRCHPIEIINRNDEIRYVNSMQTYLHIVFFHRHHTLTLTKLPTS